MTAIRHPRLPLFARPRRCATLALLVIGCTAPEEPVEPIVRSAGSPPPAAPEFPKPPAPAFPVPVGRADIYVDEPSLYDLFWRTHGTLRSRVVLYDGGRFALEFSSAVWPFFAYTGRYSREGSKIDFDWDGWSTAGPWDATGTLRGDTLGITYNVVMQMSDFMEGDYVRVTTPP